MPQGLGPAVTTIILYAGVFAVMWWFVIRPQKRREQAQLSLQNNVKVGDSILTTGGIYGKVIDSMEEAVIIEVGTDKTVKIIIDRRSIQSVKAPNLQVKKESTSEQK